jgi:outer membrane lipoprotein LolB
LIILNNIIFTSLPLSNIKILTGSLRQAFFISFLLLSGCASVPLVPISTASSSVNQQAITQYQLAGRVSVAQGENGYFGNLLWKRNSDKHEIEILSPLGQVIARLYKNNGTYTLTTADQRVMQSTDSEKLMRDALGFSLPVGGLEHWVLGRASPNTKYETQKSADGRIETLLQDGWNIAYAEYIQPTHAAAGVGVPRKITLRRADLIIKLVMDSWAVGASAQ